MEVYIPGVPLWHTRKYCTPLFLKPPPSLLSLTPPFYFLSSSFERSPCLAIVLVFWAIPLFCNHSYTDSADLATKCATTGSDFTRLASKCCSDGLSVCDPSPEASPPETDDKTKKKSGDGSFGGVSLVISLSILAGCILLIIICVFVAYKTKKTRQEETNVVPQVALAEPTEIPNKNTQGPLHVAEKTTTTFESSFWLLE